MTDFVGSVLVIGGGIAGIQAALDIADQDFKVYLVEREPSIGGQMAKLDKTFPTNDCSICILAPKMVEAYRHPNIEILSYSDIKKVKGNVGNFTVSVYRKPRFVNETKCTGCNICIEKCPIKVDNEFDRGIGKRKAIYKMFPQAVPNIVTIDANYCTYFKTGKCRLCQKSCPAGAIDFEQKGQYTQLRVGSIIVATGCEELNPKAIAELGYGSLKNVVTSLQFERILSASGPTNGVIRRLSDGSPPRSIAWIQCVGSRNPRIGVPYCSRICCMFTAKQAMLAKERHPDMDVYVFYIDVRAYGKGFEEYYQRAKEIGVKYIRGRPQVFQTSNDNLHLIYEDTETGQVFETDVEMLVLASALKPLESNKELAEILGIELDKYGFFKQQDPSLSPVETSRRGIYICGCSSGPRDIPDTIAQASAAVSKTISIINKTRGMETIRVDYPPPKKIGLAEPRIGVFVCHCGTNIAGYLDVVAVAEYAKALPNIVYSTHELFACSEDTQTRIKEAIEKHNLNRIIVAACTPRTHEPLFKKTCRMAGLSGALCEMVNIREQCSWVHSDDRIVATEKAKDLVRMAVARARFLTPAEKIEVKVLPEALIIGGGIAGMIAAIALADMDFNVYLVEKERELGGKLRNIDRIYPSDEPAIDILSKLERMVHSHKRIKIYTETRIASIKGYIGNYEVELLGREGIRYLKVGTIIVATGSQEINPIGIYGYGKIGNVITQLQLEKMLKNRDQIGKLKKIAIINCAGSRENQGDDGDRRTYCCRIGCAISIKNAKYIKEISPDTDVYILYRDIRLSEKEGEEYYNQVRGEANVKFIKYSEERKPEVFKEGDRAKVKVYDVLLGEEQTIDADLVVLTVPTEGSSDTRELSHMLKVPIDTGGFFHEAHAKMRPLDFATDGIYICGCAHAPKGLGDTVVQAFGAAARASIPMGMGYMMTSPIRVFVKQELCRGCGICREMCGFNAIELLEAGEQGVYIASANEALCKGCGICAVACPTGAIIVKNYTNEQIEAMIEAMVEGGGG